MIQRIISAFLAIVFILTALVFVVFLSWTMVILFGILSLTSFFTFLYFRGYNVKIRIRELTSTGIRLIWDRWAKIARDQEKIEFYKIFWSPKGHETLPLAPAEAIDYDGKTKSVEVWFHPEIGYVYIKDSGTIKGFEPMTTRMRGLTVAEIKKKEARRTRGWKENIPLIAGLTFLLLLVISIMIFAPEYMKAFRETTASAGAITERQEKISERLDRLDQACGQVITSEDIPLEVAV